MFARYAKRPIFLRISVTDVEKDWWTIALNAQTAAGKYRFPIISS
jgi:hypothetical protein